MSQPATRKALLFVCLTLLVLAAIPTVTHAAMKQPKMVTLSGKVIDLTCASKGHALMGTYVNTAMDHHMPDGKISPKCAEMCLRGGQPAALFADHDIKAVFACNPRTTLADFAAKDVDVQGFWAGNGKDNQSFVPKKIRAAGSSAWQDVDCATMHQ